MQASIASSTIFVCTHSPLMFENMRIVCASSFGASPLGHAPCSSNFRLFVLYYELCTKVWYAKYGQACLYALIMIFFKYNIHLHDVWLKCYLGPLQPCFILNCTIYPPMFLTFPLSFTSSKVWYNSSLVHHTLIIFFWIM